MVKLKNGILSKINSIVDKIQKINNDLELPEAKKYQHECLLAIWINNYKASLSTSEDGARVIYESRQKSQSYLDNKYNKQIDEFMIKEVEVPELDMELLNGFGLTVGELCIMQNLNWIHDKEEVNPNE